MNKLNKNNMLYSFLWLSLALFASCKDGCGATKTEYVEVQVPGPAQPGAEGPESQQANVLEMLASMQQCVAKYRVEHVRTFALINPRVDDQVIRADELRTIEQNIQIALDGLDDLYKSSREQDKVLVKEVGDKLKIVAENYDLLQESLVSLRTQDFIKEPITPQIFAGANKDLIFKNLLAEAFNQNVPGNSQAALIGYRLQYLIALRESKKQEYIKNIDQASPCHGMMHLPFKDQAPLPDLDLETLNKFIEKHESAIALANPLETNSIDGFYAELVKQIKALRDDLAFKDFIFFPGGSQDHSVLYQIIKDGPDNYTFRVFNSGAGIAAYHARVVSGYEVQVLPFVEITNLTQKNLTARTFLASIVSLYQSNNSTEELYEKILPSLGGTTSQAQYGSRELKTYQEGSSSYLSLPWLLSVSFGDDGKFAAQLEQLLGQKILHDYQAESGHDQNLLNRAVKHLSAEALDKAEESIISPGFLRVAAEQADRFHKIDKPLNTKESSYDTNVAGLGQILDPVSTMPTMALVPAAGEPDDMERTEYILAEPPLNPIQGLDTALTAIQAAFNVNNHQLLDYTKKLAASLSLTPQAWIDAGVNNGNFQDKIRVLKNIQVIYAQALNLEKIVNSKLSTTEFLVALKLMTIADMLNQRFAVGVAKLDSLQQPIVSKILFGNLSITEIPEPRWQEELAGLKKYYEADKDKEQSFFGFEKISAGKSSKTPRAIVFNQPATQTNGIYANVNEADLEWAIKYLKNEADYTGWYNGKQANPAITNMNGTFYEIEPFRYEYEDEGRDHPTSYALFRGKDFRYEEFPVGQNAYARRTPEEWENHKLIKASTLIEAAAPSNWVTSKNIILDPDEPRVSLDPAIETEAIYRKEAALMLVGPGGFVANLGLFPGRTHHLPQYFFDLRHMSYVVNYLLTGESTANLALASSGRIESIPESSTAKDKFGKDRIFKYDDFGNTIQDQNTPNRWIYTNRERTKKILKLSSHDQLILSNGIGINEKVDAGLIHMENSSLPFYTYESVGNDKIRNTEITENSSSLASIYSKGYKTPNMTKYNASYNMTAAQDRQVIAPNDLIIKDYRGSNIHPSLTLERIRALFKLSGIPKNQITETLGEFSTNSALLSKEEYQRFFEKLMLAPNLLLNELKHNEMESFQFIHMLANFCFRNFTKFENDSETKGVVFFARMNQIFKEYVRYAKENIGQGYKIGAALDPNTIFFDSADGLKKYLVKIEASTGASEKGLVYLTLASLYTHARHPLSKEEVADILLAKVYSNTKAGKDVVWQDEYRFDETSNILFDKRNDIVRVMGVPNDRDDVLSLISEKITTQARNNWLPLGSKIAGVKTTEAVYRSAGVPVIHIDVFAGMLFQDNVSDVLLPKISTEEQARVFGDKAPQETGRLISNNWYQYAKDGTNYKIKIEAAEVKDFVRGNLQLMKEADGRNLLGSDRFPVGLQYWKEAAAVGGGIDIHVRKRDSEIDLYTARVANGNLEQLSEVRAGGGDLNLLQIDKAATNIDVFKRIENQNYIDVWVDNANSLKEISLPRLGLRFKPLPLDAKLVTDATMLDCANRDKYKISPKKEQYSQYLSTEEYIMCKRIDPDNKSIEQYIALMALPTNLSSTEASSRVLVYGVPDLNSPVKPSTPAASYYLALKELVDNKYDIAKKLLLESGYTYNKLDKSQFEDKILREIISHNDDEPEAIGVRLLAYFIMLYQNQKHRGILDDFPNDAEKKILFEIYPIYIKSNHRNRTISTMKDNYLDSYQEYAVAVEAKKISPAEGSDNEQKNTNSINLKLIKNRLVKLNEMHPNPQSVSGTDNSPLSLKKTGDVVIKKENSKIDINDLLHMEQNFNSNLSATDLFNVLAQQQIFYYPEKFMLFYRIALNYKLLPDLIINEGMLTEQTINELGLAKSILQAITGYEMATINALSQEELRSAFIELFSFSALVGKGSVVQWASYAGFFERLAKHIDGLSPADQAVFRAEREKMIAEYAKARGAQDAATAAYNAIPQPSIHADWNPYYAARDKAKEKIDSKTKIVSEKSGILSGKFLDEIPTNAPPASSATNISLAQVVERSPYHTAVSDSKNRTPAFTASSVFFDPFKGPFINDTDFDTYFAPIAVDDAQINTLTSDLIDKLKTSEFANAPRNIQESIDGLVTKITDYSNEKLKTEKKYINKNGVNWVTLLTKIADQKALFEQKQKNTKSAIETKVNESQDGDAQRKRMSRHAEIERKYDVEEMIYLLLTNKLDELRKVMVGNRDEQKLRDLANNLVTYMIYGTYIQHLANCHEAVTELTQALDSLTDINPSKRATPQKIQLLSNKAALLLKDQRNYTVGHRVEYLIFEYFQKLSLRKNQVEALDGLEIKDRHLNGARALGPVREIIMGFGKTKVLLPILSVLNTKDDDAVNFIMLPEALITSMAKELQEILNKSFNRSIDIIEINRGTKFDSDGIEALYTRLVEAQEEKRVIITTNSSMQSLFLLFSEKLNKYGKGGDPTEIQKMAKIFRFLRTYVRLNIDELDMALDVLKSHQFSIGKEEKIRESITATVFSFYRMLATNDTLRDLFEFAFIKGTGSDRDDFTLGSYQDQKEAGQLPKPSVKKSTIIREILNNKDFLVDFAEPNAAYQQFVKENDNRVAFEKYLSGTDNNNRTDLFNKIDQSTLPAGEKSLMKDIAAVLYNEINLVFEITAARKLGVHYGSQKPVLKKEAMESDTKFAARKLDYELSKFIAVPLSAGAAVPGSRFGSDIEAANYTMQMALEELKFQDQLGMERTKLLDKNKAQQDINITDEINARVKKLFFSDRAAADVKPIKGVEDTDIALAALALKQQNQIGQALEMIMEYTLPQLETHTTQLFTSAQIYGSMFKVVLGFSGTLWNKDTFPDIFDMTETNIESDTTAKTFMLLWQQYQEKIAPFTAWTWDNWMTGIRVIPEDTTENMVRSIYQGAFRGSLADLAGMLRKASNLEVAKHIKAIINDPVIGVVFYDVEDNIMVLGPNDVVERLESTTVSEKDRVAYWDKKHTTGSDLKLKSDMLARVTFDQHTFARDIEQTAWRLRQLAQGQKIDEYLVQDNDLGIVIANMNETFKPKFTAYTKTYFDVGDLLLYSVINQEQRLGDLKHRALRYRINNRIVEKVFNLTLLKDNSGETAAVYNEIPELFRRVLDKPPHTYLGFPIVRDARSDVLINDKKRILDPLRPALSRLGIGAMDDEINQDISKFEGKLPDTLLTTDSGGGLDTSINSERETDKRPEKEADKPLPEDDTFAAYEVLPWKSLPANWAGFTPIAYSGLNTDVSSQVKSGAQRPLFSLKEALIARENNVFRHVDEELLGSLNYAPLHVVAGNHYRFSFFNEHQKVSTSLLVVVDTSQGTNDTDRPIKLIMLDGNDELEIRERIFEEDAKVTALRAAGSLVTYPNYKLAIYQIGLGDLGQARRGIIRQTYENRIDEEQLRVNQNFIWLLAQAKFLNGYLSYSDDEKVALENWLDSMGQEKRTVAKIFKEKILNKEHRQISQQKFEGSQIDKLFEKVGAFYAK